MRKISAHIKIDKELVEEKILELDAILQEYEIYRNNVTEFIFNNEESFKGKTGESFRNKVIEINIIATDSMNIIRQYLETYKSYHDYIVELDNNLKREIESIVISE
ncbi:MAG: hypothetical protein ACRCWM_10630 [Sarcina sp.]